MKGQQRAADQAATYVNYAIGATEPIRFTVVSGASGCGKSHLLNEMGGHFASNGFHVIGLAKFGGEEIMGSDLCALQDNLLSVIRPVSEATMTGKKVALFVDEAHGALSGKSKGAADAFRSILLSWGGTGNQFSVIKMGGEELTLNWCNLALHLATNIPDALEDSKSLKVGDRTIRRRAYGIELSRYGNDVIGEVITDFLTARGLRAADCSAAMLSRFHRGTMEALDAVVRQYLMMFPDKPTLSKDRVIEAAKQTTWFPRGISRSEARILYALSVAPNGIKTKSDLASLVKASSSEMRDMIAFLGAMETDGVATPFIHATGSKVSLTENGAKFLKRVIADGFTL